MNRIFYTPFDTFAEREGAEAAVRQVAPVGRVMMDLPRKATDAVAGASRLLMIDLSPTPGGRRSPAEGGPRPQIEAASAGAGAAAGASAGAGAASVQKLTDQNIENVVTQLHGMSANPATASQVPMVLGEARKVGLEIDLNGRPRPPTGGAARPSPSSSRRPPAAPRRQGGHPGRQVARDGAVQPGAAAAQRRSGRGAEMVAAAASSA